MDCSGHSLSSLCIRERKHILRIKEISIYIFELVNGSFSSNFWLSAAEVFLFDAVFFPLCSYFFGADRMFKKESPHKTIYFVDKGRL